MLCVAQDEYECCNEQLFSFVIIFQVNLLLWSVKCQEMVKWFHPTIRTARTVSLLNLHICNYRCKARCHVCKNKCTSSQNTLASCTSFVCSLSHLSFRLCTMSIGRRMKHRMNGRGAFRGQESLTCGNCCVCQSQHHLCDKRARVQSHLVASLFLP